LVVGCTAETPSAPSKLIDGSRVRPLTIVLEGVDGSRVATVVRSTAAGAAASGRNARSCIAVTGVPGGGPIVGRVGVSGRSITFFGPGRRTAHACDATSAGHPNDTGWCGQAFGQVHSGRLRDPRLSLSCRSEDGDPVGFAWIQPAAATAYVVVRQSDYAEVYAVAGDAPVRVTTSDVDLTSSGATFSISEHTEDGGQVRSYELEAQVAG
jgi:hypothetical protein